LLRFLDLFRFAFIQRDSLVFWMPSLQTEATVDWEQHVAGQQKSRTAALLLRSFLEEAGCASGVLEPQLFNRTELRDLRDKLSIAAAPPQIIQLRLL
jgi:hypothetical protein